MRRLLQHATVAIALSGLLTACGSGDEAAEPSQVIDLQRPSALVVSVPPGSVERDRVARIDWQRGEIVATGRPRAGPSGSPVESAIPALAEALPHVLVSDVDGIETFLVSHDALGVARRVADRGTARNGVGGATVNLTLPRRAWPEPEGPEPPAYQIAQRGDLPDAQPVSGIPECLR